MGIVAADRPELTVGAIVAYECLLDGTAGTTTWRVGSILALPSSSFTGDTVNADATATTEQSVRPKEGRQTSVEDAPQKTSRTGSGSQDEEENASAMSTWPLVPSSACQTVLIQPWISWASATDAHGDAGHVKQSDAAARAPTTAAGGGASSGSPSPHQHAVTPVIRLAEIEAIQAELAEIQRFAQGEDDVDADVSLAAALSQACTRVFASSPQPRVCGSEAGMTAEGGGGEDIGAELAQQIEQKRVEFGQRVERILSELRTTRNRERELREAHKTLQVSLEDAKQQLRDAQEKVQRIDKRHLREIQGYRLPPAGVKLVMDAVFCVLGETTTSWTDMVAVMRHPSFIAKVVTFDHARLTPAAVQVLKEHFISNPRFSYADALKGSRALGQFHEWVMRQMQLVEAGSAHAKFMAEKSASGAALAAARQNIEAETAALRHVEEELETLRCQQTRRLQKRRSGTRNTHPSGGDEVPPGGSPPSTNFLASAPEPQGEATASLRRSATKAESSTSEPARLRATGTPAVVPTASTEATASYNAAAGVDHDGAQRQSSTLVKGTTVPVRCASAPHTATNPVTAEDGSTTTTTDGVAAADPPLPAPTLAQQQQQLLEMVPPGAQWMCPEQGTLPTSYILRSSILCIVSHQQEHRSHTPRQASLDSGTRALEPNLLQLTTAQQHLIAAALRHLLPALPPPYPTAAAREQQLTEEQQQAATAKALACEAEAALIDALWAQLTATEAATNFCRATLESQRAAALAAKERQTARWAAVSAIREKIEKLAESCTVAAADVRCRGWKQRAVEKKSLTRELIVQLKGVEKEKAEVKASIAKARSLFAALQQQVLNSQGRAVQLKEARRAAREKLEALTKESSREEGSDFDTETELVSRTNVQEQQEVLVSITESVRAASTALKSVSDALETHQQQRAAEPKEEKALIAKMFREADGRMRNHEGSNLAAQIMMDVHKAATGSFPRRHQWTWMNVCLGALLLLSLTTLQYKKYRV
ncbi:hypothetical protein JIQ42_06874 [Leishmania sp. Namibia]|uniref:hypothetical protein n=1 Tax=Leishmania sp. Namibia TaxID=2802991 RepID=UPI001B532A32|nr:hypothetical protein JIQ42_06874 [Leishmania sp. Namibia]